jgi:hypothetical protein
VPALPECKEGCDVGAEKVAWDYPGCLLDKIVSASFAESGSPAYGLVANFKWSNSDQNTVAKCIVVDKMSPEAAAKKRVEANRLKVESWLEQRTLGRGRRTRPVMGAGRTLLRNARQTAPTVCRAPLCVGLFSDVMATARVVLRCVWVNADPRASVRAQDTDQYFDRRRADIFEVCQSRGC